MSPKVFGHSIGSFNLGCSPHRRTPVSHLPGPNEVIHRLNGLSHWRCVVISVQVVDVNVVGLHTLKSPLDGIHDVLAAVSPVVDISITCWPEDLARDDKVSAGYSSRG